MNGLNRRIGVEGFICLVRNSPEYHMEPKWYFSNQALVNYMRVAVPIHKGWDIGYVSAKLEAFAIAGCNSISKSLSFLTLATELIFLYRPLPNF